jgi:hypothetical protein
LYPVFEMVIEYEPLFSLPVYGVKTCVAEQSIAGQMPVHIIGFHIEPPRLMVAPAGVLLTASSPISTGVPEDALVSEQ